MLGIEHIGFTLRFTTVVVPVAVYFMILGLLNSRRHPQLLTARRDFILLLVALSPLFVLPVLQYFGPSLLTLAAAGVTLTGIILLFSPRGPSWVIYNISTREARNVVASTLRRMGLEALAEKDGFRLPHGGARVHIGGFALLRNVSIRLHGADGGLVSRFENALAQTLIGTQIETTPMATVLLLVATAMLVAPLTLVAHRAVEIVRIISDLLQ